MSVKIATSSTSILTIVLVCLSVVSPTRQATFSEYKLAPVDLGSQAKLYFKTDGTNVWFLVEKTMGGYLAFGIGKSMASADIVVISKNMDSTMLTLTDCGLAGTVTPSCTESSQDWKWAAADSYTTSATMLKAEVMRPLKGSGKDGDQDIPIGEVSIIYAYTTSNTLTQHDSTGGRGTANIDLSKANTNPVMKFTQIWVMVGSLLAACLLLTI